MEETRARLQLREIVPAPEMGPLLMAPGWQCPRCGCLLLSRRREHDSLDVTVAVRYICARAGCHVDADLWIRK